MIPHVFSHPITPARERHFVKFDSQRHKLYAMEREFFGHSINTHVKRKDLKEMSEWMCYRWRVPAPKITFFYSKKTKVFGYADEYVGILLNSSYHGANYGTLIHELAHWIKDIRYGTDDEDHGPLFASIYRSLMADAKLMPQDCFDLIAKRYGVEVAEEQE